MSNARTFHLAYALGHGCTPSEAMHFADYAGRAPRRGEHYLSTEELFEDWDNLMHVARVEFELYGARLTGLAS